MNMDTKARIKKSQSEKLNDCLVFLERQNFKEKYKDNPYMRLSVASQSLQRVLHLDDDMVVPKKIRYCSIHNLLTTSRIVLNAVDLLLSEGISGQFIWVEILDSSVLGSFKKEIVTRSEFDLSLFDFAGVHKEKIKNEGFSKDGKIKGQTLMHQVGSHITYARRYTMFSAFGIHPDERAENASFPKPTITKSISDKENKLKIEQPEGKQAEPYDGGE